MRYRTLVEATGAVTWTCPPSGLPVTPQPAWMAFTGQTAEGMLGAGWAEAVHPEDVAVVAQRWRAAVARGETFASEHRIRRHDGEWRWMSVHAVPIRNPRGEVVEWFGMNLDITERKRTEAALDAAQERGDTQKRALEAVLQALPVGVIVTDAQGGVVRANRCGEAIWGSRPATREVADYAQYRAWWADSGRPVAPEEWASAQVVREGVPVIGQILKIERFDGGYRYVHNSAVPIRDEQGTVTGCAVAIQDITEVREAEEALRAADRRKDEFLATLAHELRNPLAPLRTGLDLMQALRGDVAACEQPLQMMDRQLTHLVRLVDDLLDVSRITRGKIELRKERLDLAEIIAAALEMSHSEVGRGDRRLTVSVPREPLAVEGDRVRMVQVVSNLLNNAAKFTDEGAHIRLDVVPQGDRVEIRVQDDGRGIPRERLSDVFELFAQAEPGHAGGLGIGLSLVRSLVAMHNGTISAHSEGPGHGAAFTVSLPLCRGVSAQPRPSDARKTDSALGRRVLVVDDNRDIAEGMRLLLRTLKVEVRVAHNGAEAIRICEEWSPTHVLMDLGMPGMDGYEAARRLCARHPDRTFRLVAISGWGQDEHRQLAREAGFDQHLTKPVKLVDLETVLSP